MNYYKGGGKGISGKNQFTKKKERSNCMALPAKSIVFCNSFGKILSRPKIIWLNNSIGCCGMAGSFGMKKNIMICNEDRGLVLFPEIRRQSKDIIIAAPGTSSVTRSKMAPAEKALQR